MQQDWLRQIPIWTEVFIILLIGALLGYGLSLFRPFAATGVAFAFAAASGVGCLVLAEMLDKSIRSTGELAAVIDSHLVVALPYITTVGEVSRRRRKIVLLWSVLAALLSIGLAAAFYIGISIDFSWFDRSWIDALTRLTK